MNSMWRPKAYDNYPMNNCLATVKSKVQRETDRYHRWHGEEKHDELVYSTLSPRSSPYHHYHQQHLSPVPSSQSSTSSSSPPNVPMTAQARVRALKLHLRDIYDKFGSDESNWRDRSVVRSISGLMRAIGDAYLNMRNLREALEYLRASWELKKSCRYCYFADGQVVRNLLKIAEIHETLGEPKMARLAYSEVLPLLLREFGPDHDQTSKVYTRMLRCTWSQHPEWRQPYRYL